MCSRHSICCSDFGNNRVHIIIVVMTIALASLVIGSTACPADCKCVDKQIDCGYRGFGWVPVNVPADSTSLHLQWNNITVIHRKDFAGLKDLRVLNLADNQIHVIEKGSFDDLVSIDRIRLNRNKLTIIPDALFSNLHKITRIELSHNSLRAIGRKTFKGTQFIKNLLLDNNELTCISELAFRHMRELENLVLNNNNLTTLPNNLFANLHKLKTLLFASCTYRRISQNQLICNCNIVWFVKWLRQNPLLGIFARCASPANFQDKNLVDLKDADFMCNNAVGSPTLDCVIQLNCPAKCFCTENLIDCRDKGLSEVPRNLADTVMELRLELNQITEVQSKAFTQYKNLQRIDLSNNRISKVAVDAFEGLLSLKSLVLYGNLITDLPTGVFRGLVNLELLLLNANRITCVRVGTFSDLRSLSLLSLYDNKIQSLANGSFNALQNLQTLHLARNPFICDCNLQWLAVYVQTHPVETSGAKCESPERMQRKKIGLMKADRFKCKGSEEFRTRNASTCQIDIECPADCTCNRTNINCGGRRLTQVPVAFPSYVTEINLSDNEIEKLTDGPLKNLSQLKKLNLRNNKISLIEAGALDSLLSLEELNLAGNSLSSITRDSLSRLTRLRSLILENNKLTCVSNTTYNHLENLQVLSLSNNEIRCIQIGAFDGLKHLTSVDLTSNSLNCNCHMTWLPGWLRSSTGVVNISQCLHPDRYRGLEITELKPADFKCEVINNDVGCLTGPPPCCNTDGPDENSCDPRSYCPPECKCTGTEVRCSHEGLTDLPKHISLDTTELYVDDNSIVELSSEFKRLSKLTSLDLSNNHLSSLGEYVFANFSQLHTLILSYNKLQCLHESTFAGLKNLRVLSVHGNELSSIPFGAFKDMIALTHLALGHNPLYCDCELKWLADWIRQGYREPGIAACVGPEDMQNKLLLTTPSYKFQCHEKADPSVLAKCNICYSNPCMYGGTCVETGFRKFKCQCVDGYYGERCERLVDACFGNPCENAGTCTIADEYGRFSCACARGFEGDRCETNIDDCLGNACTNHATCLDGVDEYTCTCPPAYTGEFCEKKLSFCRDYNPCAKAARCIAMDADYGCECTVGYTGKNCDVNIDDCSSHDCQNGATCVDGVNAYQCVCATGFTGRLCEIAPVAPVDSNAPSRACHSQKCKNGGICAQQPGSSDQYCRCPPGFDGRFCQILSSISLLQKDSYISLSPLHHRSQVNVTLTISTQQGQGVILYQGFDEHIAVEVFRGRVRVSYNIGNYPVSTMFSYEQINDGKTHRLEILMTGKNLTMKIDSGLSRTIVNEGEQEYMELDEALYIGGLPASMKDTTLKKWHVRNTASLIGCFRTVHINGRLVDFGNATSQYRILPGCIGFNSSDSCEAFGCQNGNCRIASGLRFVCDCYGGYSGALCDIEPSCQTLEFLDLYVEPKSFCTSRIKVKHRRCDGSCNYSGGYCCQPKKVKSRKVQLFCPNGTHVVHNMPVIRKCQCSRCV